MLHGAILRSPIAHARIVSIDTTEALAHPKVHAVITGKDLEALNLAWAPTLSADVQAVLATDKVRFQGQEVAFVVAEDRYAARDALELIDVEYEHAAAGRRRPARARPGRPGDPRRPRGPHRQPHLRLGGRRQGGDRRGLRPRRRRGHAGDGLPARAPGADGDLRRGRRLRPGRRQADALRDHPGAARPPHAVRAGRRHPGAQDPGHLAGHRRRLRQQGRHLPRLRLRRRRLDRHRPAGEVGGGPLREPDVHLVRPRLPHAGRDRGDQGRQDPRRPHATCWPTTARSTRPRSRRSTRPGSSTSSPAATTSRPRTARSPASTRTRRPAASRTPARSG